MKPLSKVFIGFAFLLGIGTLLFFTGASIGKSTAQVTPPSAMTSVPASPPAVTPPSASAEKEEPQVIHILVKGGYSPRLSHAQAGKPLRLDMETVGVYDCSSSIYIPSLHFRKFLPATGVTAIDIPPQEKGSTLTVLCAMGMYSFDVQFD
jgi:hypothetical protein